MAVCCPAAISFDLSLDLFLFEEFDARHIKNPARTNSGDSVHTHTPRQELLCVLGGGEGEEGRTDGEGGRGAGLKFGGFEAWGV